MCVWARVSMYVKPHVLRCSCRPDGAPGGQTDALEASQILCWSARSPGGLTEPLEATQRPESGVADSCETPDVGPGKSGFGLAKQARFFSNPHLHLSTPQFILQLLHCPQISLRLIAGTAGPFDTTKALKLRLHLEGQRQLCHRL